ncbi:hypothetical protein EOE18_13790 [Novosphingobium umbonatum]|uniref:Uncharacterized protein n=1 Tax=Novosphingobium umbonatum TaxID=1908524 RepID=A0A437N1W9_9SPHN|nr:hypothetical protein [Novosphingobium umbonatum]RVU03924.1 hypothetical protein EOE18_13790 [Novosphingobium umbonatum]
MELLAILAFRAITIWRSLRYLAGLGLRWAFGSPARLLALLAVAALAMAAWQYRRAESAIARESTTATAFATTRAQAEATRRAAEAKYRKDAADAQAQFLALSADADARFAAYAAAHRLRPSPSPASQPTTDRTASLPEIPTTSAVLAALDQVWITRADWRACDADYSYALAAHQWAGQVTKPVAP